MWPAELQPQYRRVYSDPTKVQRLIALDDQSRRELNSNFHLGVRFAESKQRWYPERHLTERYACASGSTISLMLEPGANP